MHRCKTCGHGFVSNRPDLASLTDANADASTTQSLGSFRREAYETCNDARDVVNTISRYAALRGRSLDIGAGSGTFSYFLSKIGFHPTLLDLDPRVAQATQVIPHSEFRLGTFETFEDPGPFAAILMSQVLEHALDPKLWLARSRELLAPSGLLAIAVPNFGGVYRILGTRDPFLIPPVHVNFFTPCSLRLAIEGSGLRLLRMESRSGVSVGTGLRGNVRKMWNAGSRLVLDRTVRGIVLLAFARKEPEQPLQA